MIAHTRSLREGSVSWPSDFEMDKGVFKGWAEVPLDMEEKRRRREANVGEVEAMVANIVEANWSEVCVRRKGPGGNPMLRFAVWALCKGTRASVESALHFRVAKWIRGDHKAS